jgi:hypothetical protein
VDAVDWSGKRFRITTSSAWLERLSVAALTTMDVRITEILANCEKRPPATRAQIDDLAKAAGIQLPADYVEFLMYSNGAEGFVGEEDMNYLALWPVEDVRLHSARDYALFIVFIGSNGGGEGYGYDRRSSDLPIVNLPFIGVESEPPRVLGRSLLEFLQRLHDAPLFA